MPQTSKRKQYETHFRANVETAIQNSPQLSPQKKAFIRSMLNSDPMLLTEAHVLAAELGCGLEYLLPEIR